jgi:hypothetical protein
MSRRPARTLLAAALAALAAVAAPSGSSAAPPSGGSSPPARCEWHGLQIVGRVNVGCPLAQKVVASYYGVTYPEFKGWRCRNDPPDYSDGRCRKGSKKFRYTTPAY